jgi:hypothetical protein
VSAQKNSGLFYFQKLCSGRIKEKIGGEERLFLFVRVLVAPVVLVVLLTFSGAEVNSFA